MRTQPLAPGESLPLSNDGQLELFFIGTGGAFAELHYHTNFILVKGKTHLAVDCGLTFKQALRSTAGLVPTDLKSMLITHAHPDHAGSLADFALRHRYPGVRFIGQPPPTLVVPDVMATEIWEHTLRGGLACNERPGQAFLKLSDYFQLHPVPLLRESPRRTHAVRFGELSFELFRTMHIPESSKSWEDSGLSYGLYLPDERLLVSVDTRFDPDLLAEYGPRADTIFHDVQFFTGGVHAPLAELQTLDPDLRRRMYLMHYTDDWLQQDISGFAGWAQQGVRYIFD